MNLWNDEVIDIMTPYQSVSHSNVPLCRAQLSVVPLPLTFINLGFPTKKSEV